MKKDILKYLERDDKWFLSDGMSLLWAPPFAEHINLLGFWERAYYFNYTIDPLFTMNIFQDNKELDLKFISRTWTPDKLSVSLESKDIFVKEHKTVLNGCLNSEIFISNMEKQPKKIDMVIWSGRPTYSEGLEKISEVIIDDDYLMYTYNKKQVGETPGCETSIAIGCSEKLSSYSINISEGATAKPIWRMTPFFEKLRNDGFSNEIKTKGIDENGILYMALHCSFTLAPSETRRVQVSMAFSHDRRGVKSKLDNAMSIKYPYIESRKQWEEYFNSVPYFSCSDPHIEKYYWYRWYSLRLNRIHQREGNYRYPFIAEGIGFFRNLISYSSPCNMMETKWLEDPEIAYGIFYNFINHQRDDGCFPGIIGVSHRVEESMYHAHWAKAILEIYNKYKDKKFLLKIYSPIRKYVEYFMNERDEEKSGLYDIVNQVETGQEYSPRYIHIEKDADKMDWDKVFRLKGVDASVYIYEIKKLLQVIAQELDNKDDSKYWKQEALKTKDAIIHLMWDEKDCMFYDVNPKDWQKTKVKSVTCFYPFMTDIVDERFLDAIRCHLLNPEEFWTEYPVPTVSIDNEFFSSEAEWKNKRHLCPWNGRVWPMTESHVVEILYNVSRYDKSIEIKVVELLYKFIKMMFYDGDVNKPNCYEHYNPFTGKESFYRGVDDYQHSWVVDLIIKYVCGVQVNFNNITINPLPFGMKYFELSNLVIDNKKLSISWNEDRNQGKYRIFVEGDLVYQSDDIKKYFVDS